MKNITITIADALEMNLIDTDYCNQNSIELNPADSFAIDSDKAYFAGIESFHGLSKEELDEIRANI